MFFNRKNIYLRNVTYERRSGSKLVHHIEIQIDANCWSKNATVWVSVTNHFCAHVTRYCTGILRSWIRKYRDCFLFRWASFFCSIRIMSFSPYDSWIGHICVTLIFAIFDVSFAVVSHLRYDAWTAHEFFLFFCFECNGASFCTSIHWFPLVLYVTLLSSIWIQSYQCAMHLALSSQVVSSLLESILIILIYRFLCCLFRGYK